MAAFYLAPALALYALFVLWPLARVVWLALRTWNGYGPSTFTGLGNFTALWGDAFFRTSLLHSLLWDGAGAVLPTALGLGLALLIHRSPRPSLGLAVLFFPALLPATGIAAIWVLLLSPVDGPVNSVLRAAGLSSLAADWLGDPHLALPALFIAWLWSALGIATLILWSALRSIGREYLDLARVEGAGPVALFRWVLLPGIRRTAAVALLVEGALAAAVFDLVFVTTGGGPGYATMTIPLEIYSRAFGGRAGQGAAAACIQIALDLLPVGLAALLLGRGESLHSEEHGKPRAALGTTLALGAVLILFLLPLLWLLVAAFKPGRALTLGTGGGWTWNNVASVWSAGMGGAMETSILLAAGCVALSLLLTVPAAFALAHLLRSRVLRYAALALLLAGLFQPTTVLVIPLFSLLHDLGLLNDALGILLPETARTVPFAVLLLWAAMAAAPTEIMAAAAVDGAGPLRRMVNIAVPLAWPALIAVAIWSFVTSWNEYLLPTLVSQDGSLQTVPTLLATAIGTYNTQYGALAAGSLLATLPVLVLFLALHRRGASGLDGSLR